MVAKITVNVFLRLCILCGMFIFMPASYAVPAIVDYVLDGDTFAAHVILDDNIKIDVRVRISDIDAPELKGRCDWETNAARLARYRLMDLLPIGTMVELSQIDDDKYLGRIDARVALPDGRDVSEIMIHEKLARPYDGGARQSWCE